MHKKEFDLINEHQIKKSKISIDAINRIRKLLISEDFGVLCTTGKNAPYGSIVAFAANNRMDKVIFATPSYTRKYQLLNECDQIAMLIDNRSKYAQYISKIEAVTLIGKARHITENIEIERLREMLLSKHNYLKELVLSESCAIFEIDVLNYFYVTHLQEVYEWSPLKNP